MIAVEAALIAESAGMRMRIDSAGNVIRCRLEGGVGHALGAAKQSLQILRILRIAVPFLVRSGLRLDIIAGDVRVVRAGSGVKQNALGRLLGVPSAKIGG